MYKKKLDYKNRGAIAPHMCLQSTCNAVTMPFEEGMQKELEIFKVLVSSGILFCIAYVKMNQQLSVRCFLCNVKIW